MEETNYSNTKKFAEQISGVPGTQSVSEHLTKAQRRKLKKEKRKEEHEIERAETRRKKRNRKIRNYGITILLILIVGGFFYWRSIPAKDAPIIEITPSTHNFGTVSQARGTVSAEMTISNKGVNNLIIDNLDSSCGCTSAAVVYKGVEGPIFSMAMHGTNPKDWKQVIPPGESAHLKVYYNPNVHKELRGSVTRSIFVFSNDPKHRKKEVRINAYQVD